MCVLDCDGQKQTECILFGEKTSSKRTTEYVETIRLILVMMIIQLADPDMKSL